MSALAKSVLKKSGGSLVVTVPASARKALKLEAGTALNVSVEGERLIFEPDRAARPKYTLAQLLAEEKAAGIQPRKRVNRAWLNMKPVGREIW
jgi:antitoxin ChpS